MKLIFERSVPGRRCSILPACDVEETPLPESLRRAEAPVLPELSEQDLSRHYTELNHHVHGVNCGFYPLGSCTMKYNPRIDEEMAALPGFTNIHPLAPAHTVQGCRRVLELAQQYLDAQDDAARDKIIEDIQQDVADQIPSTLLDKWTAWRYVNMLGNFKTQGRNIVGNVGMQAVQRAKDGIATAIESIAYHASGGKFERTKSFTVDKALRDAAKADFKTVEAAALGEGKYHEGSDSDAFLRGVEKRRTIFKNNGDWGTTESSNPFVRAARITTDTAAKGLEGYRRATNWAMEQGDVIFSKGAYAHALAGYLKAHQVTADQFSSAEWQSRNGSFVDKARL